MDNPPSERLTPAAVPRVLLRGAFPALCALLLLCAGLPTAGAQEPAPASREAAPAAAPAQSSSAAPAQSSSAAPAQSSSAAPAQSSPAAPAQSSPAAPAQSSSAAPAQPIPAGPLGLGVDSNKGLTLEPLDKILLGGPAAEKPPAPPVDDDDDADDGDPNGSIVGISGCIITWCLTGLPELKLGSDGQIAIDGGSVAIGGDGGDGGSLIALGIGLCLPSILAPTICDQVGANNAKGGKGGSATAKDGNGGAVALAGGGGDGGLISLGLGICGLGILAPVTCDDVGSNNGTGGNGGRASAVGGSGDGTGVAFGGEGGDGGLIGLGIGVCALGILSPITCDDVGSNNGAGGSGGLASVLGGAGSGTGVADGGDGGDGGIGVGVGICSLGIIGPVVCDDVGSDNARGGKGGAGIVDGTGKSKGGGNNTAVAIAGDGGNGGVAAGVGVCALNILLATPCGDVGSNGARGGDGGTAVAKPGGGPSKPHEQPGPGKPKPGPGPGKPKPPPPLAETGRASIPLVLVALVTLILGAGLVGTARRSSKHDAPPAG